MSWCLALVAKGLLSVGLVGFSITYGQALGQEQVSVESTGTPRSLPEPPFHSSPCGPGAAGQQAPPPVSLTSEPEFGAVGLLWKDFGPGGALGRSSVV